MDVSNAPADVLALLRIRSSAGTRLTKTLRWRQNGRDSVSNHQPHDCLFNRLFRRRSKKTSKLRVTGLCVGNSPGPVNSPHKGPVTRKMFPFDDVIMMTRIWSVHGPFPFIYWNRKYHVAMANITATEPVMVNEDAMGYIYIWLLYMYV